jgi:hypothetical protein
MAGELFDRAGQRKYLTADERAAFLRAADRADREVKTFCYLLHYTGCRISEACELTFDRVDLAGGVVVFETKKKRRGGVYRAVPVPPSLLELLDMVHGVRERQEKGKARGRGERLWGWSLTTAWRRVKEVMETAGLGEGPQVSPKGLRHGFGVHAVSSGVPLNKLSQWLGHAQLSTTAIYADAVGAEEKSIAARMWGEAPRPPLVRGKTAFERCAMIGEGGAGMATQSQVLEGTWEEVREQFHGLKFSGRVRVVVSEQASAERQPAPATAPAYMYFGMFQGEKDVTEEDYKAAEFHGDPDDGLDWSS